MMSTTSESTDRLNRLHALWIADPTKHEAEFFAALRRKVSGVLRSVNYKADGDMISDAFVHVFERVDRYKPIGSFSGWVYNVVRCWSIDLIRHEAVVEKAERLLPTGRRGRQIGKTPAMDDYYQEQSEDDEPREANWTESLFEVLRLSEQETPHVDVSWVEDQKAREVCELILAGRKLNEAAAEVGLTKDAARKRLRRLSGTYQVVVTLNLPLAA